MVTARSNEEGIQMRRQPIRIVRKEERCFAVLQGGLSAKPGQANQTNQASKKRQGRLMVFLLPPLLLLLLGVQVAHLLHWF